YTRFDVCTCYSVLLDLKLLKVSQRKDLEINNPLAAYKLMKRVRAEWATIFKYTKLSPSQVYQKLLEEDLQQLPDQDDLDEAAHGIIKLQETYKLYPQNITTDPLTGRPLHLDLGQSFHLGQVAYTKRSYQHAFLWFLQCLSKIKKGEEEDEDMDEDADLIKATVFNYLSLSAFKFGNLPFAIHFSQQLVNLDPSNLEARLDLAIYKSKRSAHTPNPILTLNQTSSSTHEALCRGEAKSRRKRQLTCRYSTVGGNPRLMYAPVKEEEEWDEPLIIRYHNIISDEEIELLKNLSRPWVSTPLNPKANIAKPKSNLQHYTGLTVHLSMLRPLISMLSEEYDPVVSRVTQRLSDITGMDMESADFLEVLNYGIGGEFLPHYDTGEYDRTPEGQRIATIIIYLTSVSIGGATVFPNVGVSLKPQKGSAVMWYNLLRNGQLDKQTLHAGCPVFQGSKWSKYLTFNIATKWVREQGQEFRRRCALSKTE
ncbi:hypothetical protein NFI96_014407, partial [Prochilodus magdalenae]